jgi:LuxR family maltose regulon positive regulatory protein
MAALTNALAARSHPIILVLDDYHAIDAQPVHDALAFMLGHQPAPLHLIIATRADPPLPVAGLRGRAQLAELRLNDLRFSRAETALFLRQQELALSAEDVAKLDTRTEGWVAGIHMAAISLQGHADVSRFIHEFSGSNRHILDYLVEEVLQRQPPAVRTFLYETSVLDRLTAPLCDAVVGRQDSQDVLATIEQANLFIIPLDDRRQWYRYHPLFSDLLLRRLQQLQPDGAARLHKRASQWYRQAGLLRPAIHHALAAADYDAAVRLIAQAADQVLMRGELRTFLNWVEALPEHLLDYHPRLRLYHAAALLSSGQSQQAIEKQLEEIEESAAGGTLTGEIDAVRALLAVYRGENPKARMLAHRALSQLPEDDLYLRGLVFSGIGIAELLADERAAAIRTYDQLMALGEKSGNPLFSVTALCWLGRLHQSQGNLRRAHSLYEQALEAAVDDQGKRLPLAGLALAGLGEVWREWGEMDKAVHYLQESIELGRMSGEILITMSARLSLARIWQAQGDAGRANQAIREARQLAQKTSTTELDALSVSLYRARLWLRQRDLDNVRQWVESEGLSPERELLLMDAGDELPTPHMRAQGVIVIARLRLAEGKPLEALQLLEALRTRLALEEQLALAIEIRLLEALAHQESNALPRALKALEQALRLAEPEAYVRIFVDEGAAMARLLYEATAHGVMPEYAGRLLAAFPEDGIPQPRTGLAESEMVEPLSAREVEVLQLIADGLSNQEIATRLVISLSTVKGHTSNIYGKLRVGNRTGAVARAKVLGILPER